MPGKLIGVWAQTTTTPLVSGTESDPYLIANIDNLYWLSKSDTAWFAYYEQTADIDASESSTWADSSGFSPIANNTTKFTGIYHGQGYVVDSLTINRSSMDFVRGLVGENY